MKNNADLLRTEGKIGVALARDAFFGEDIMRQCTTKGYGGRADGTKGGVTKTLPSFYMESDRV